MTSIEKMNELLIQQFKINQEIENLRHSVVEFDKILERINNNDPELTAISLHGYTGNRDNRVKIRDLTSEDAQRLATSLETNTFVETVDLSGNINVGADGTIALAKMLISNKTIHTLVLSGCNIGAKGTTRLAETLKINSTLKNLDLSDNVVRGERTWSAYNSIVEGLENLANAMTENKSLQVLNLSSNELSIEAAIYMAKKLHKNSTLQTLDLGRNGTFGFDWSKDKVAMDFLVAMLLSNKNLKNIILDANKIQFSLAEILQKNSPSSCTTTLRASIDEHGKDHTFHPLPVALFMHPMVKIIQNNTGNDVTELCRNWINSNPESMTSEERHTSMLDTKRSKPSPH